ncbi:DUF2946 family protein [Sphingomonas sp. F9_3S_D5_B_2]
MTTWSCPKRLVWAALFAMLLAIRSLAPAGFMPAFDKGAITIVACPDAGSGATAPMQSHGGHKSLHQSCPYASVSTYGALGPLAAFSLPAAEFALVLFVAGALLLIDRGERASRPPVRGPPIRA